MSDPRTDPRAAREGCTECGGCDAGASRRAFLQRSAAALAFLAVARLPLPAAAATLRNAAGAVLARGRIQYDVPPEDGVSLDRENEVILVRWQGGLYAFALSCPHQRTMLRWREDDGEFQCPKHHSKYRPDGVFLSGRATRGMDRYDLRMEGGRVVVDTGTLYKEDENAAAWAAAAIHLGNGEEATT